MDRKNAQTPRMDRKTLILTAVGALLVIAIIVIAVVLMQRTGSDYERNYAEAMELYVAGEYGDALAAAQLAADEDPTEEAVVLLARCCAALGDYDGAVERLEGWVAAHGSGSEAGALLAEYRSLVPGEGDPEDENTVVIASKRVDRDTDTLILADAALTEADLEAISSLSGLTSLSLNACSLDDLGFLAPLGKLTTLSLEDNAIESLEPLAGLRSLKALYLSGNSIGSLEPLYGLDGLLTLDIRGRAITDTELEKLQSEIPGCTILTDEPSAEVKDLSLGGVSFRSDATELDLSGLGITDISVLAECTALERLDISGNVISSISALAALPNLKALDISDNEISNLSPLIALSGLESLDASGNAVANVAALSGHTALKSLSLDGNPLENIDALASLTGLETLSLRDTGLNDAMLGTFYSLAALRSLDLDGNAGISGAAADALIAALPGCEINVPDGIYSVELGGVSFDAAAPYVDASGLGLTSLEGMERFTNLQILVLDGNPGIDLSGAAALDGLASLELAGCELTDVSGLAALGSLQTLNLMDNSLRDISPLRRLSSLTELHLSGNGELTDISALAGLTGLTRLSLNGTAVSDLRALELLTELETLDIEGCRIDSIEPLLSLKSLKTLYAAGCGLSAEEIDELGRALPDCTIYT